MTSNEAMAKYSETVTKPVTQTVPSSSPFDTLKSITLQTIDRLDYVIDQLAGGVADVPEHLIEFVEFIQQAQFEALNEHMPVEKHVMLNKLRVLPAEAYRYDDGSPVKMSFKHKWMSSHFFPRYTPEETARAQHLESVAREEQRMSEEESFDNIVRDVDWGRDGSSED